MPSWSKLKKGATVPSAAPTNSAPASTATHSLDTLPVSDSWETTVSVPDGAAGARLIMEPPRFQTSIPPRDAESEALTLETLAPKSRKGNSYVIEVPETSAMMVEAMKGINGGVSHIQDIMVTLIDEKRNPVTVEGPDLSNDDLVRVLRGLRDLYGERDVQQELHAMRAVTAIDCSEDQTVQLGTLLIERMHELLLKWQLEVVALCGLTPTQGGLLRIQNAARREICLGNSQVRKLTSEAQQLLGFPALNHLPQEHPVEALLAKINESNIGNSFLNVERLLREQGSDEGDEKLATLKRIIARYKPRGPVGLGLLNTWRAWELYGLPPELGAPLDFNGPVAVLHKPSMRELFAYVMRNQPVIIKDGLDAEEGFPPLRNFRDFGYLRYRCGHREVKVKADSTWDHLGRQVFINDPCIQLPMNDYLKMVEDAEYSGASTPFYMGKVPLPKEIPELAEDIQASPGNPMKRFGACFGPLIPTGVHTYFGCGKNTTGIHCDPHENLLVVISGTKTFELYPPNDADCMYTTVKRCVNSPIPPLTVPNAMSREVEAQYPLYRNAKPVRVDLVAGDMFYLPIFWWHGVTGSAKRNMILNHWTNMHPKKFVPIAQGHGATSILQYCSNLESQGAFAHHAFGANTCRPEYEIEAQAQLAKQAKQAKGS